MLAAASAHPPAFACLLVDDSSRLSRSVGDADGIVRFARDSESAGLLTAVFGGINEQYLVDLGRKTFRGVEGLAQRKLHTWGLLLRA